MTGQIHVLVENKCHFHTFGRFSLTLAIVKTSLGKRMNPDYLLDLIYTIKTESNIAIRDLPVFQN